MTYNIYRGTDELFVPDTNNRIAQGLSGTVFVDGGAPSGLPSYYVVRAVDADNGSEESNLVRRRVTATGPVATARSPPAQRSATLRSIRSPAAVALRRNTPAGIRSRRASTRARAASVRAGPTTPASP